jgi:hypothetical protein
LTGEESIVGGFCGHEQPYWTIEAKSSITASTS